MERNRIAWWLWAVGAALIALSWFQIVTPGVGWIGFAVGMSGSVLGWSIRPSRPQSSNDDSNDRPPAD